MSKKEAVQNVSGHQVPLKSLTLGFAEIGEVEVDETVQNYLDSGVLVKVEAKGTK